jgi:pimeloyl-ACP methyl ester carboxylesterase
MSPFLGGHGFRVYSPDFLGYGLSDNRQEYWGTDHVEFIHQFVSAIGLDQFYLAGNSMGLANTWRYVEAHEERVFSYILIAGGIGNLVDPSDIKRPMDVNTQNRSIFDGTKESMRAVIEPIIYRKEAISDDLLEMRTKTANLQREALKAQWGNSDKATQGPTLRTIEQSTNRFVRMTMPGLMLWGADDVLNPVRNAYLYEDKTPNIQYFYPPECGHQGQTDQPDMFNQVFVEFFGTGKVSRKTADWAGVSTRRAELAHLVEQQPVTVS